MLRLPYNTHMKAEYSKQSKSIKLLVNDRFIYYAYNKTEEEYWDLFLSKNVNLNELHKS